MNVLEFLFHPRLHKDRFLKSCLLEPKGKKAQPRGFLAFVGELRQALPTQAAFLGNLATQARDAYFESPKGTKPSGEKAFGNALKASNAFLKKEAGKNRLDWLGNLHSAFLCVVPGRGEKMHMHFAKSGNARIILIRGGSLTNIGKELDRSPHSAKVGGGYGAVGSGTVLPGDRILVLSPDVADAMERESLMRDLAFLREEKQLKELFRAKDKEFAEVSGILWIASIPKQEVPARERVSRGLNMLSFPKIPVIRLLPAIKLPVFSKFSAHVAKELSPVLRTARMGIKIIPVVLLLAILGIGSLIFQGDRETEIRDAQNAIERIQSLRLQAEQALGQNREREGNRLFQEAWQTASVRTDPGNIKRDEFAVLLATLNERLRKLNQTEILQNPEVVFTVPAEETTLLPQRLLLTDEAIFLFNPFRAELLRAPLSGGKLAQYEARSNLREGFLLNALPAFFSDPGTVFLLNKDGSWEEASLESLSGGFRPDAAGAFEGNVYLADSGTGSILRYAEPFAGTPTPSSWIDPRSPVRPANIRAMAIDGNIWTVSENATIQRWFKGVFQEELEVVIFPELEKISGIKTSSSLPYLFLLDQGRERIIVLTKFGDLVRQYESPAFSNLRDVAVSSDGSLLYVLAGTNVFRIRLDLGSP